MADRMRNHEKAPYKAHDSFPSGQSLLDRLNQIDDRLRQLEEKERPQESYFTGDLSARSNPLPPTMDDVHLKHTLMERLHLLETKIRQLSNELHQDGNTSCRAITFPAEKQKQMTSNNSSRRMVGGKLWRESAEILESQRSNKKVQSTLMPKRVLRCMRSCIFCTGDDHCCLNSSSSDDCEGQGIHAGCYH